MIKLVIFDLDGTLVNAYPAVTKSVNHTLKAMGFAPRSRLEVKRSVGGGDRKLMAHFVGEKSVPEAIAIYRPHHAKALRQKGGVTLMPGAEGVLKFLKARGCKLAIASNRPTKFTRIILKESGILKFFDAVLCADRVSRPKPHPDILWAIAGRLKFKLPEVLYVGDMTIDVLCARQAGVMMAAVSTGSSHKKELKALKPLCVIGKITQLRKLFQEVLN
ncbi:MAG: HAD family hydrolase [Candidatus Omnitrophica bacterium]|nr:HAD family hydrolase [Candidatus Omnitrophota bacterium]MDE2232199.1 HAD family hydrolase [Candidatus Omnitrophota bacterium]